MWLYDLLALFRNVRTHRMLGKRALLEAEPMLRERGLLGGARFYDAQCDDARLVLATVRSAIHHGALVANYTAVRGPRAHRRPGGRRPARGPAHRRARRAPGQRGGQRHRPLGRPGAAAGGRGRRAAAPAHQGRPRRGGPDAGSTTATAIVFTSPIDGRVLFILPWGDLSYIGTTDTDTAESPDQLTVSADDIVYLLRSANARFPNARLGVEDVRATWAGLRPLLADRDRQGGLEPLARARDRVRLGRDDHGGRRQAHHLPLHGGRGGGPRGAGAAASRRAAAARRRARTDEEPLPGGEAADLSQFRERGLELGVPPESVEHLLRHYGTEAAGIYNLGGGDRRLLRRLVPPHPAIEAEVVHAVRRELAQTVEDVHGAPDCTCTTSTRIAASRPRAGWRS